MTDSSKTVNAGSDTARAVGRFEWERALRAAPVNGPLDATAKAVGYALATWSTTETGADARPGAARLVLATGKSESTIWRALRRLREAGWLDVRNADERSHRRDLAHDYQLTIPAAHWAPTPTGHPRPLGVGAPVQWAPVQSPVGTHAHTQAHDLHTTSAARGDVDELGGLAADEASAARRLLARLEREIDISEARDCILHLVGRERPPDDVASYTRGFDAADVRDHAERFRTRRREYSRPGPEICAHGEVGGTRIIGAGPNASRKCARCELDQPAIPATATAGAS